MERQLLLLFLIEGHEKQECARGGNTMIRKGGLKPGARAFLRRAFVIHSLVAISWGLGFSSLAKAQRPGVDTIEPGNQITVRTTEPINARNADGREFLAVVDRDVVARDGDLAIPRGSDAWLIVRKISGDDLAVDLDSVRVDGRTYQIAAEGMEVDTGREGPGVNGRTGEYVGGGALIGAIVGAIVGGGKGAAIGAGAGAAAGAGTQVLTRGRTLAIPSESLLTFDLQQPLRIAEADDRFSRDGHWYRRGYGLNPSSAYLQGLQDGRMDAQRGDGSDWRPNRWAREQARRDYTAGYTQGFQNPQTAYNGGPTYGLNSPRPNIAIGADNRVSWQAPEAVRLYVQVDDRAPELFAQGQSGTQGASWISPGHLYVFVMRDRRGNELAREQLDLRGSYGRPGNSR
jgi:hypothetical protein